MRVRLSFERPARVSPRILAQDFVAFGRHFRARLRVVLGDALALGTLILLGLAAEVLWFGLVRFDDREPFELLAMLSTLVCAPIAAFAASGAGLGLHAAAPGAPAGIPVGPRTKALAEALLAVTVMALVRVVALSLVGLQLQMPLRFWLPYYVWSTVAAALLMLPAVFAWTTRPRIDLGSVTVGAAVAAAIPYATTLLRGWTQDAPLRRVALNATLSAALCTLALVLRALRIDVTRESSGAGRSFRLSRGPLAQLRGDRTLGALTRLAPLLVTVLVVPPLLHRDPALLLRPWTGTWLTGVQLLLLLTLPLLPLGLPLTGPSDRSFWAGSFARAWSALPLPPESVLRSVWGHAIVTGLAVWCFFVAWIRHFGDLNRDGQALVAIALASVPILAGVVVCVAAGEPRRGGLAIAALLAICSLVPVMPLDWGIEALSTPDDRLRFTVIAGGVLALLGGLPPLGLLRRPRRSRAGGR